MITQVFDLSNYTFSVYAIPTFLTTAAIFLLGIVVLTRERGGRVGWLFFVFTLSISVWLLSFSWMYCASGEHVALWWAKTAYLGVAFIPSAVYHFSLAVLRIDQDHRKSERFCWALSGLFCATILNTDALITGLYHYWWGYYPKYGWLGIPFITYFFWMMIVVFRNFWMEYRKAVPGTTHKFRVRALMIAFSIAYLGSFDYLAKYGIPVYPFGYVPIFVFLLVSARTIWQYNLADLSPAFAANQILETMQGAVLVADLDGMIRVVNRAVCSMLGRRASELLGTSVSNLVKSSFENGASDRSLINAVPVRDRVMVWHTKEGRPVDVSVAASVVLDQNGETVGIVYVALDITERKRAEEALALLVKVTEAASESADIPLMISRCLETICKLKGWRVGQAWFMNEQENVLVCVPQSFYSELDITKFRQASLEIKFKKGSGLPGRAWEFGRPIWIVDVTQEEDFRRASPALQIGLKTAFAFPIKTGQKLFAIFEFLASEIRNPDPYFLDAVEKLGSHLGIVFERRRVQEALAEQAIRDPLTGMYNRRYFNSRIQEEILKADQNDYSLAILLCDVDDFKTINDTHGHHIGDAVLKRAAHCIQKATRGTDLVVRWGGDEIVVVLLDTPRQGVLITADRIRREIRGLSTEVPLNLDLSIGVALYPEHGTGVDELIRLADRALYIAKRGGDKVHIGEEEYHLDEHTIKVVFQPIMDVRSNEIVGHEALSRDAQEKIGILELFKRYQAIGRLNDLKCICFRSQLKTAQEAGLRRVFINVDFDLIRHLENVPKPSNLEVVLEISEFEALHDIENHLKIVKAWRAQGFKFAMDDFGAGFISLPFIALVKPNYIKMDRSMILQAVSSKKFREFSKGLVSALKNYVTEGIIAEGIETLDELHVVEEMGVSLVQGFLLGHPQKMDSVQRSI